MKKIALFTVVIGLSALLFSFTNSPVSIEKSTTVIPKTITKSTITKPNKEMTAGEKIYKEKCVACHQADGNGLKGAFPPLKNSDYLKADPKRGINQVLNGSNEEMTVNGEVYKIPMPVQVTTKEDALAVINYVLKEFNGYSDDKLLKMAEIKDIVIKKQ